MLRGLENGIGENLLQYARDETCLGRQLAISDEGKDPAKSAVQPFSIFDPPDWARPP